MKRLPTGIKGLDKLCQGGFPQNSSVLVCGSPGTGKSIFGLQYLYKGATKYSEKGLYVTIEERPENLRIQAKQFGWDIARLEKQGKISFLKMPIDEANVDIITLIKNALKKSKAKRLVIDSLSILAINATMYRLPIKVKGAKKMSFMRTEIQPSSISGGEEVQQFIYVFISRLADLGVTTLFIADSPQGEGYLTRDTVSEFACDSVIQLKSLAMGKTVNRTLEIKKMRSTAIVPGINTVSFSKDGIAVSGFNY